MRIDTEELYARAFKHGAGAALEYIEQNYPQLATAEDGDDYPSVAKATMEHIEGVAALIAFRPRAVLGSAPTSQHVDEDPERSMQEDRVDIP